MAKENPAAGATWPASMQIACDRFANLGWKRKLRPATPFTEDGQLADVPIDIRQIQRDHLAGAQAQPNFCGRLTSFGQILEFGPGKSFAFFVEVSEVQE